MNLRKTLLKDWPVWLIMIIPFIMIGYYWDQIPEQIGMHWNSAGEVDRWEEKGWQAFLLPLISMGVYVLLIFLPYIDPKRKTDNAQKAMRALRIILPLFFSALSIVVLFQWMGSDFKPSNMIYLTMCVFFLVFGNYMQTIKPNYFVGIRTPWTLESEDNWRKTHRLGGKLWVGGALLMITLWFFIPEEKQIMALLIIALGTSAIAIGYSFALFMQERGTKKHDDPKEQELT
ncbi:MAG: SdpI family protein [Rhodothermales bacterium]